MTDTEMVFVGAVVAPLYLKLFIGLIPTKPVNGNAIKSAVHDQRIDTLEAEVKRLRERMHWYGNCLVTLQAVLSNKHGMYISYPREHE